MEIDVIKTLTRRYNIKNLDYFLWLLENLKTKASDLSSEIALYIDTLKSLDFNKTYEIVYPNTLLSDPINQIFDKEIKLGKFSYSMCFDIEQAQQIIKKNNLKTYPVNIQKCGISQVYINESKLQYADLTKPLIAIYFTPTGEYLFIDGMHRIRKAQLLGVKELKTYVLYPYDFLQCVMNKEIIPLFKIHHNYCTVLNSLEKQDDDVLDFVLYQL